MSDCPLCFGEVITKTSSQGRESWCSTCRAVLYSSTLKFRFAANIDVEQNIEQCQTADGHPGFKGPGEKATCYGYEEGNEESKKKAHAKAAQAAYMKQKRGHVAKLIREAGQFGGQSTSLPVTDSTPAPTPPDLSNTPPSQTSTVSNPGLTPGAMPGGGGSGGVGIGVANDGAQELSDQNGSASPLNQNM